MEEIQEAYNPFPKPDWFTKLVLLQGDMIYNSIAIIFSPILSLFSTISDSYHHAEEATETFETAVQKVPSGVGHGCLVLVKRLGVGFFGAAYVGFVLMAVLVLAVAVGVGIVHIWVEEPVFVRESLYFDYAEAHPKAVFEFGGHKRKLDGVPVGHTFSVSLGLLMPESGYNRDIGVFQLSAEILSTNAHVVKKSSLPCMLRFRSLPVRLARTFILSLPLIMEITSETQKLTFEILNHKEGYPRTEAIRITLIPRAGTTYLPQLYEAEIVVKSKLPWSKELVRSWKWTFYVWSSLYIYFIFLITLICCCKQVFFPMTTSNFSDQHGRERESTSPEPRPEAEESEKVRVEDHEDVDVAEMLRKWRRSQSKRKAIYLRDDVEETAGSSASSFTITKEETSAAGEDDVGDSESVC
ncbi:hypothetical protein UlMin_029894 [Ulmus minor]